MNHSCVRAVTGSQGEMEEEFCAPLFHLTQPLGMEGQEAGMSADLSQVKERRFKYLLSQI